MTIGTETKVYDVKDVASILDCSLPTARKIMHQKGFPLIKVGTNLKVYSVAFEQWCMQQCNR